MLKGNRIALVTGMHRSGTSVTARAVTSLGLDFGGKLMEENYANPLGYFEDREIVYHNRALLTEFTGDRNFGSVVKEALTPEPALAYAEQHLASVVRTKFMEEGLEGCKDPRFSITFPFWEKAFEACSITPIVIFTNRNPLEVAKSLHKIHEFELSFGLRLWFVYNLATLCNLAGNGLLFLTFQGILSSPRDTLYAILNFLDMKDVEISDNDFEAAFLNHDLKHYTHSREELREACADSQEIFELYTALSDFKHGSRISPDEAMEIVQQVDRKGYRRNAMFQLGHLPFRDRIE